MNYPLTDHSALRGGPGIAVFNGISWPSAAGFTLDMGRKTQRPPSDAFGPLSARLEDDAPTLKHKPVGSWANLTSVLPFLNMKKGQPLRGADVPLYMLSTIDMFITQFKSAAVIKQPDFTLGRRETVFDDLDIFLYRGNGMQRSVANSLYTDYDLNVATVVLSYGTGHATSSTPFLATAAAWSTAINAIDNITTDGGVTVTGAIDRGGLKITWVSKGARATNFSAAFTGCPANTVLTQTVVTAGDTNTKEVRILKFDPWTSAMITPDATAIPTQPYVCILTRGTPKQTVADATARKALSTSQVVPGDNVLQSDTGKVYVLVAADPSLDASWQLSIFASFSSLEPIKLTWGEKVEARVNQTEGTNNHRFDGMEPKVEITPDNMDMRVLDQLGVQGQAMADLGSCVGGDNTWTLDIYGNGVWIRLYGVGTGDTGLSWVANKDKVSKLGFTSGPIVDSNGLWTGYAYVGTQAPS